LSLLPKEPLTIWCAELSVSEIGAALKLTPEDVIAKFRDARITSWFAEIWGERLFSYRKHTSSNHPGSDASIPLGAIGRFDISVRCLTRAGIKFQKSKNIGSGRSATLEDVYSAIEGVERVVVVDIREFPRLRFIPLDSKWLLRRARHGKLTPTGMTAANFEAWLDSDFSVPRKDFSLDLALTDSVEAVHPGV
jgi:hypothetical protein